MIKIEVNNVEQLLKQLTALSQGVVYKAPLMRQIAGTMQTAVECNFAAGGRRNG